MQCTDKSRESTITLKMSTETIQLQLTGGDGCQLVDDGNAAHGSRHCGRGVEQTD